MKRKPYYVLDIQIRKINNDWFSEIANTGSDASVNISIHNN